MPSRLSRHQRKQTIYIIGGIAAFILVFMTFGISLLAQGSVFLTSLFRKDTEEQQEILGAVEITDIPDATSSATIKVAGYAEDFDKVRFIVNSDEEKEVRLKASGEFEEDIDGLKDGENEIYVIAVRTKSNRKKASDRYTVTYYKEKPKLEISEPSDNSKTTKEEIKVAGSTDKGNSVTINGSPAVVDSNGGFYSNIKLKEGENKVVVRAMNSGGAAEEKTLTINYQRD